ncbi:MAG TPA: inositol monophosphatase family protein [Candidatus Eisenbacteria bacterium]|nr:inositol monophosphatase family protein [Candidatus Eisenbacteria bacterium]
MTDGSFSKELALAEAVAREAGALLKENFGREQSIEFKGRINLVTEMDRRAEDLIVKRLQAAYPGDDIWAEEGSGRRSGAERAWVVDPLDGTTNYAHEYPVWSVSIALAVGGEPVVGAVYNPLLDDMYSARRGGGAMLNGVRRRVSTAAKLESAMLATGFSYDVTTQDDPEKNNLGPFSRFLRQAQAVRRAGSAALAIAKVGVGRTDGFWEGGLHAWDMAAAMSVVVEGGGRVTNYAGGKPALDGRQLVATNGTALHQAMLDILAMREGGAVDGRAGVPSKDGEPPPEWAMRQYVVAFLYKGPNPVEDPEESKKMMKGHLANIQRLHDEGKVILAGPYLSQTDLRGYFLFDTDSVDAARAWCDTDPAISAGVFRVDLHPWYSAKGIGIQRS